MPSLWLIRHRVCLARSGWELTLQEVWCPPGRWLVAPRWQIFVELRAGQPLTCSLGSIAFVYNRFPPVFSPQTGRSTEGLRFQVGLLKTVPESPYCRPCRALPFPRQPNVAEHPAPGLLILMLWSAAAGCNNRMPMCIGSFSLHSKWIGLSTRDPNSSVIRRDVSVPSFRVTYVTETFNLVLSVHVFFLLWKPRWLALYYWQTAMVWVKNICLCSTKAKKVTYLGCSGGKQINITFLFLGELSL